MAHGGGLWVPGASTERTSLLRVSFILPKALRLLQLGHPVSSAKPVSAYCSEWLMGLQQHLSWSCEHRSPATKLCFIACPNYAVCTKHLVSRLALLPARTWPFSSCCFLPPCTQCSTQCLSLPQWQLGETAAKC